MKFYIEYGNNIGKQLLVYLPEECSFYTGVTVENKASLELILNQISLRVVDNKVIDVSGFCGIDKSMLSDIRTPEYNKGTLSIKHNLNNGFAYGINVEELPVHVNNKTGWVCIGDPSSTGEGVEFISNCVAIINNVGELMSLWLHPQDLPGFIHQM